MLYHISPGLWLFNGPLPEQPQPPRDLPHRHRLRHEWKRFAVVLPAASLQLLFRCTLCPAGAFDDTRRHTEVSLAFFSTFEPVDLTPGSVMQREGVPMFYDSASSSALPSLYICPVKNVLGRVPLIPCFVEGNTRPTIPYRFGRLGRHVIGGAAADSRPDGGNGSRLYELHPWMWRYGRGHERKVSIVKSMEARAKRLREERARAGETVKRGRLAAASRAAE